MKPTLAFDVYGTLINTAGVFEKLEPMIGSDASRFMREWRHKQLEYSFRRAAMNTFVDFSVVTREALDYCCLLFKRPLEKDQIQTLMDAYKVLPAFQDVEAALEKLPKEAYAKYAFSNGSAKAVSTLLHHAGLRSLFNGVVSVEDTRMFKPNPVVYEHFNIRTSSKKEHTWLVSGNPFDVMGAISYGMRAVWVQRSPAAVFDTWGFAPTAVITDLGELPWVLKG